MRIKQCEEGKKRNLKLFQLINLCGKVEVMEKTRLNCSLIPSRSDSSFVRCQDSVTAPGKCFKIFIKFSVESSKAASRVENQRKRYKIIPN